VRDFLATLMAKAASFAARTEYRKATDATRTVIVATGPDWISVLHPLTRTDSSVADGLVLKAVCVVV
jgi:hypothetical protein